MISCLTGGRKEGARQTGTADWTPGRVARAAAMCVAALLSIFPPAAAQSQLVTEQNLGDAILERQDFVPIELDSLDINRDGTVNIADLTYFVFLNAGLVPSVSFDGYTSKAYEGDGIVGLRLVFTKPLESAQTLVYSVGGTATYGPKAEGGDYTVAGYDPAANEGTIDVNAGDTEANLEMTIHDDALFGEGVETVTFQLTGGSTQTYFLGINQSHIFYVEDNDAAWTAGLVFPQGSGYESFDLEITQEEGVFSARVRSDGALIATPEPGDPKSSGVDGWDARCYTGTRALRIEIGPLPVEPGLSFFDCHRIRSYVIEIGPGLGEYRYDPRREFTGIASEALVPVKERLGAMDHRRRHLRREQTGAVVLSRHPSKVTVEEVELQHAE